MGSLIDGQWHTDNPNASPSPSKGRFKRADAGFRSWITANGAAGPSGTSGFKAEPGRYHLYVSYACPWAHRALIMRSIKGLAPLISVSVAHWFMGEKGWSFEPGEGVIADPVRNAAHVHELYSLAKADYTGRVTVPVLWDLQQKTIVSNESSEIIRMFNTAFDGIGASAGDYYPAHLRSQIDTINERIYNTVNNGVYKSGFATSQSAYEQAVKPLFETLNELEGMLSTQRYLLGAQVTEADWRLLTTLLRFDLVYHGHFKCNLRRLIDYPSLWAYTRDLYQAPGVAQTCDFEHMKKHYYQSHESINPTRIVPIGPVLDFSEPPGRDSLGINP